ncbi:hypothetical protein AAC387_Pa02g2094 [Persea americana]
MTHFEMGVACLKNGFLKNSKDYIEEKEEIHYLKLAKREKEKKMGWNHSLDLQENGSNDFLEWRGRRWASGDSWVRNAFDGDWGCLGVKLMLWTVPNLFFTMKPRSRWIYENTGSKRRFTDSAAERGALRNSENLFSFKMGFEEIRG